MDEQNDNENEKEDAREHFENQLSCAFVKYDYVEEEEDTPEVTT